MRMNYAYDLWEGGMAMEEFMSSYWLGRLDGFINGISMRCDLPSDIQEACVKMHKEFDGAWEKFYNKEG